MRIIKTQDGNEALVTWTCPECSHRQDDTVHPELGPYISCTCGECGKCFSDEQLSPMDIEAWNKARDWAESQEAAP